MTALDRWSEELEPDLALDELTELYATEDDPGEPLPDDQDDTWVGPRTDCGVTLLRFAYRRSP
jgi:hypothetical protein